MIKREIEREREIEKEREGEREGRERKRGERERERGERGRESARVIQLLRQELLYRLYLSIVFGLPRIVFLIL